MESTTREFTVTLEDMSSYKVRANYGIAFENECFNCWIEVCSILPINSFGKPIVLNEIESALAYLIIDEHEDFTSYQESRNV